MLAIVAAVIFVIAFLLEITGTATNVVFAPTSLMLLGLACLALHIAGIGTGWNFTPRRRRLSTRPVLTDVGELVTTPAVPPRCGAICRLIG